MANRYENRYYGRGGRRGGYGYRSDYGRRNYGGTDYDIDRYDSSRFGGYDYDRQGNYFGGGGSIGYGSGYTGVGYDRGYSSYNRPFEEDYGDYNQPSSTYTGGYGRNRGYSGESYYGGGYDRDYDYDRGSLGGTNYGRANYSYSGSRGYTGRGGYDYDRENYGGYAGRDYDRGYRGGYDFDQEERGWFDKASDEVASWFGDEEAERRRRMDARDQGHRGRGPRNYSRSDDRIKEDINDRLTDNFFLYASDINVEVNNGEVTLTGTVDSRYAKRLAEDIAEDVSGVKHMENRLRVNESFYDQGDSSYTNTTTETNRISTAGATETTGATGTTTVKSRSKTA